MDRLLDVPHYGPGMTEGIRKHMDLHLQYQVPVAEQYGLEFQYAKGSKAGEEIPLQNIKEYSIQKKDGESSGAQLIKYIGVKGQTVDLANPNTKRLHVVTQVIEAADMKYASGSIGRFNIRKDMVDEALSCNIKTEEGIHTYLILQYRKHAFEKQLSFWISSKTNWHLFIPVWKLPVAAFKVTYRNKKERPDRVTLDWDYFKAKDLFFKPETIALPNILTFTRNFYQK